MMVGLTLINEFVVQNQRQAAKHEHNDGGDERHHGQVPRQYVGDSKGDQDRRHECAGRSVNAEL